ncbi:MAG: DsbA family protein [Chloroflexi bacterium]|nr:DsbA family protein [Chloroflexota bacterium]
MAKLTDVKYPMHIDVYFDYTCPFVYNASIWLQRVKGKLGAKLAIHWRYFSLEQVNNQVPQWRLWEQPDTYASRGLRAFWAAEAARWQGEDAFDRFHTALLKAGHEQGRNIADLAVLIEIARDAGLDISKFEQDMTDRRLLTALADSHTAAAETLGVFGTPTLVFPERQVFYLKMSAPPPAQDCLALFEDLYRLIGERQYVLEVKRPQVISR